MHRALISIAILALILPSSSLAGTSSNPEITDPTGDTTSETTGMPVFAPSVDLVGVWFEEASSEFTIRVHVADLTPPSVGEVQLWRVSWTYHATTLQAEAQRGSDGIVGGLSTPGDGGTGPDTADGTARIDASDAADVVTMVFPRTFQVRSPAAATTYTFDGGAVLAQPSARSFVGHGTSDTGLLLERFDQAGPGRDFTFASSAQNVWSGVKPAGEDIDTDFVKLDGVSVSNQRGTGSFTTYEFQVRTENKFITWNGTSTRLHVGDDVLIHDFHGNYIVTGGNTRFNGTATKMTITPA